MAYIFDITSSVHKDYNKGANFWGSELFNFDGSVQDKAELLKVARNYVRILTGFDVKVSFCLDGDKSYTDGKSVVISSVVKENMIDSTIGLALHEASHIVKSNFKDVKDLVDGKNIPTYYKPFNLIIKDIANWVEDRRIDSWAYNEAVGYKKYYEAFYNRYFLSAQVSALIKSKSAVLIEETLENYMFYLINSINPDIKMDELKGLPEIKTILDIDNVDRWVNTKDTIDVAVQIFEVILNNLPPVEKQKCRNEKYGEQKEEKGGGINVEDIDGLSDEELKDLISKILADQTSFGNGTPVDEEGESDVKPVSRAENILIEQTIDTPSEKGKLCSDKAYGTRGGKHLSDGVLVLDKVDMSVINNSRLGIFERIPLNDSIRFIEKGLSVGKALAKKLQLREEIKEVKYIKLKRGKLYKKTLYSAGYNSENLFYDKYISKFAKIGLHISVDSSGSMRGAKWDKTMQTVATICRGTAEIETVRTQLSFRFSNEIQPVAVNFYDSAYDKVNKLHLLKYLKPYGGTPEGHCFEALAKTVMKPILTTNTLFINISDGEPEYTAIAKTRSVIEGFRKSGISILSYFINERKNVAPNPTFMSMYGKDGYTIDVDSLSSLSKTINKKLLILGANNGN